MTLGRLKKHIETFPNMYSFKWSLSDPFIWIADESEIAFSLLREGSTREKNLEKIEEALNLPNINEYSDVNFEENYMSYSKGEYFTKKVFQAGYQRYGNNFSKNNMFESNSISLFFNA